MRIYKCNRCGTQFIAAPDYTIMRKPKITDGVLTNAAWIDLCPTCTTSFLTWLHPSNQDNRDGDSDE